MTLSPPLLSLLTDDEKDDWWWTVESQGKKTMPERAADKVKELLQKSPLSLVDKDLQTELQNIMKADARQNEVMQLPEIQY